MPDTQTHIKQRIEQAHKRARAWQRPVLASYTWEIPSFDAFHIIQNTETSHYYFTSADRSLEMLGCADALVLTASGAERFQRLQYDWSLHRRDVDAILYAFSGFSFDTFVRPQKNMWEAFGEASLVVPKFLYRRLGDTHTLTVSTLVSAKQSVEQYLIQLADQLAQFSSLQTPDSPSPTYTQVKNGVDHFKSSFQQAKQAIKEEKVEKIVIAREEIYQTSDEAFPFAETLRHLEAQQLGSYIFLYQPKREMGFFGATPERLVKKEGPYIETAAIAGTTKRPLSEDEAEAAKAHLLHDQKNLEEHQIVVKDIQHALAPYSATIKVPESPRILETRSVYHLHTPIRATLDTNASLLSIIESLHPTPALGGYPKRTSVRLLRDIERFDRGWYGSPFGWLSTEGEGEFVVAIRSALVHHQFVAMYAGCGIVQESELESELAETEMKLSPIKEALGLNPAVPGGSPS
ncbi:MULTISPECIES: isochorismate synthase [Exiguobacterium]|uniref:isochorismate synthase n=1 Tax=Exiguobacterium TaxID=33986 RepID=UPI001BE8DA87|nr:MULTISPECIES: isochorismate synthase [Exiguobacterium]MCT4782422.1 isochorismate synthase [Exiguobacterium himgiriensis]